MTNQGTDAHILSGNISEVKEPKLPCRARSPSPTGNRGRPPLFALQNCKGGINCAAFEPTKNFRGVVKRLIPETELKHTALCETDPQPEKLEVLELAERILPRLRSVPRAISAWSLLAKSGLQVQRCKTKHRNARKGHFKDLDTGFYGAPCARRHLSKPLVRMVDKKVHPSR
jgi:tRNA(Ile2)-agmatinylcytidine synthase